MSLTQNLNDNYGSQSKQANSIVIEISEPQNHMQASKKYTDYLVTTKVSRIKIIYFTFLLKYFY